MDGRDGVRMKTAAEKHELASKEKLCGEAVLMFQSYQQKLNALLASFDWSPVGELAEWLWDCWGEKRKVFIIGNGGSAANAIHIANDFIYGIDISNGYGLNVEALTANSAVITCLANDTGYGNVFAQQLKVKGAKDDILIALSGSGSSINVVNAIDVANSLGMKTSAVLGFQGGECKQKAQLPIHFEIDDMQMSEDAQVIVGHMLMQWLSKKKQEVA